MLLGGVLHCVVVMWNTSLNVCFLQVLNLFLALMLNSFATDSLKRKDDVDNSKMKQGWKKLKGLFKTNRSTVQPQDSAKVSYYMLYIIARTHGCAINTSPDRFDIRISQSRSLSWMFGNHNVIVRVKVSHLHWLSIKVILKRIYKLSSEPIFRLPALFSTSCLILLFCSLLELLCKQVQKEKARLDKPKDKQKQC